jgi:hypothetical protein
VAGGYRHFHCRKDPTAMESRVLLATTFLVTNTNDDGAGSLRQAILDANAAAQPPTIDFQIGTGGPQTIFETPR